jgi:hypothetical protein
MSKTITMREILFFAAGFIIGGVYFKWIYPFIYSLV